MGQEQSFIITVSRKSRNRRYWRELGNLLRWGLQRPPFRKHNAPFGVLGHEGFSVKWRKLSDEVELNLFAPLVGPSDEVQGPDDMGMVNEMREAITAVIQRHGYKGVYFRER
jgi:hypothetical protein